MVGDGTLRLVRVFVLVMVFCAAHTGCQSPSVTTDSYKPSAAAADPFPRELEKISLPTYRIEPPDVLLIDAITVIPKPPYRIAPLDLLLIRATGTLSDDPISNTYSVAPEGIVDLGPIYGNVFVAKMTPLEAQAAVEKHLKENVGLKAPKVSISLAQSRRMQQIRGEHLVTPDGTVTLGVFGSVYVTGLTLAEAKTTIESFLSNYLLDPEVSLSVTGYNSKVFYVIFDGGGYGQTLYRLPVTGGETVLDAIAQLNGLPSVSSLKRIWIARPNPPSCNCDQLLPVDWLAITRGAATATNYQILPGDRIHVEADFLIATDSFIGKVVAPYERLFGVSTLGVSALQDIVFFKQRGISGGNGSGTGGVR